MHAAVAYGQADRNVRERDPRGFVAGAEARRTSVQTQTDLVPAAVASSGERWATVKFVWRNKLRLMTCLAIVAAMGWQLKQQAADLDALRAASAKASDLHTQQLAQAREEEQEQARAALQEAERLHAVALAACHAQGQAEQEQQREEARARREQVKAHRMRHRHGEVDEADHLAEKEALRQAEDTQLLSLKRSQQEAAAAAAGVKRSAAEAEAHQEEQRVQRERRRQQQQEEAMRHRAAAQQAQDEAARESEESILRERAEHEAAARAAEEEATRARLAQVPTFRQAVGTVDPVPAEGSDAEGAGRADLQAQVPSFQQLVSRPPVEVARELPVGGGRGDGGGATGSEEGAAKLAGDEVPEATAAMSAEQEKPEDDSSAGTVSDAVSAAPSAEGAEAGEPRAEGEGAPRVEHAADEVAGAAETAAVDIRAGAATENAAGGGPAVSAGVEDSESEKGGTAGEGVVGAVPSAHVADAVAEAVTAAGELCVCENVCVCVLARFRVCVCARAPAPFINGVLHV